MILSLTEVEDTGVQKELKEWIVNSSPIKKMILQDSFHQEALEEQVKTDFLDSNFHNRHLVTQIAQLRKKYIMQRDAYRDGLILVKEIESGLYGYINEKGKEIIPCQYNEANPFILDVAWVKRSSFSNNWILINKKGKEMGCLDTGSEIIRMYGGFVWLEYGLVYSQLGKLMGPFRGDSRVTNVLSMNYSDGLYSERNGHRNLVSEWLVNETRKQGLIIQTKDGYKGLYNAISGKEYLPFKFSTIENLGEYHYYYYVEDKNGKGFIITFDV